MLCCSWHCQRGEDGPQEVQKHNFRPDDNKKSAFWLGESNNEKVFFVGCNAEAELSLGSQAGESSVWAVGGFQLVSNARQIKIFLTFPPKVGESSLSEESYLTTIKGLQQPEKERYKALCAVPGGPRPVVKVRLVFENVDVGGAAASDELKIYWVKLTARLSPANAKSQQPPPQNLFAQGGAHSATIASALAPSNMPPALVGSGMTQSVSGQSPSLLQVPLSGNGGLSSAVNQSSETVATSSDVGAAMAGLHFSLKSTEERIMKRLEETQSSFQQQLIEQQQKYISSLQQIVLQQQTWIDERLKQVEEKTTLSFDHEAMNATNNTGKEGTGAAADSSMEPAGAESDKESKPQWQQYALLPLPKSI